MKHYLLIYTYTTDGEEFLYRKPIATEEKGKALEKYIKELLAETEEIDSKWVHNKLELPGGTILELEDWYEIPEEDYEVLIKYF